MLSVFDGLRSVTTLSVFVRLACAFICGGIIGIERSYKRRPAGFRTHILICSDHHANQSVSVSEHALFY